MTKFRNAFIPPKCVCSQKKWVTGTPYTVNGLKIETFRCVQCCRPALFVDSDGGNAFVLPIRECVSIPRDMSEYVDMELVNFFRSNISILEKLRVRVERELIKNRFPEAGINPEKVFDTLDPDMDEVDPILLGIYGSDLWWTPTNYNRTPLPPNAPDSTIVYTRKPSAQKHSWINAKNGMTHSPA